MTIGVLRRPQRPSTGEVLVRSLVEAQVKAWVRSSRYLADTVTGSRSRALIRTGLPGGSTRPLPAAQMLLDETVKIFFQVGRQPFQDVSPHVLRDELAAMVEHLAIVGSPHASPPAPDDAAIEPMTYGGLEGEWMTFSSGWRPHPDAPGAERWTDDEANGTVHVGLLRHDDHDDVNRPWLVLLHGAEMGRRRLDARILRAQRLHDELGVNVAMPILPRHGPRGPGVTYVRGGFPRDDLTTNIHGMAQAVWDVRRLLAWLREGGADTIGVYGFSLGGNIAAQLAQHESDLAALIVGCPAVDMIGLIRAHLPARARTRHRELFEVAAEADAIVSPLGAPSVLQHDALMILGASHDQLADPLNQVSRLWEHWDRPELQLLERSHVSFMFGDEPTTAIAAGLRSRGVAVA